MRMDLQSLFRERGSLSIHVNGEGKGVFVVEFVLISVGHVYKACCFVIIFVMSSIIVGNVNEETLPLLHSVLALFFNCVVFIEAGRLSSIACCSAHANPQTLSCTFTQHYIAKALHA